MSRVLINIGRMELLGALKRVSILSSEKTHSVKILINSDGVTLISISPEVGEAKEVIPLEYSGEPVELGFNARYLMDVLEAISQDVVQVGLIDELSPTVIKPVGDEVYISVIMPMRV